MTDPKNLLANIDANGLIGKMLGGMATKNFAAGLLTGGVATSLFGGKHAVENMAKMGGLALLGTLAYKAYGNYKQQQLSGGNASVIGSVKNSASDMASQAGGLLSDLLGGGPPGQRPAALPSPAETAAAAPELSLAIMRAMIGAAKADGHMDAEESRKIMSHLEASGTSPQEKMLLMQELANSQDINAIASAAQTPQDSAQIYLAALLVCDSQCVKEQQYLSELAAALRLEPGFTAGLQQQLLAMQAKRE